MAGNTQYSSGEDALQKAAQEDDQRSDLAAMIAASRELGPDMDRALVESYLTRHKEAAKPAVPQPQPPAPAPASHSNGVTAGIIIAATLAAYCVALVVSHGFLFWLIFPMMGWLGGWGFWGAGNRANRHAARYEYRIQKQQLRQEYRARRRVPGVRPWEWADDDRDDQPTDMRQSPPTYHV